MLMRLLWISMILLSFLAAANSGIGQPRKRAASNSNSATASAVYSRYIEAVKNRDFKTIIDLTFSYQQEVARIKASNPRALWPKLIGDYYSQQTSNLTEASSFWTDFGRQTMAMMGDPSQGLRAIFYYLPQSARWKVSEIRKGAVLSPGLGQYAQTTIYVTVDYPFDAITPLINKSFLKQTMLNVSIHSASQLVVGLSKVDGTDQLWTKPYPASARSFLEEKYRTSVLHGEADEANDLIELIGWEKAEAFLLGVLGSKPPRTPGFDLAVQLLSSHRVQKAVPAIIEALEGRDPTLEGNWPLPDQNLVTALSDIGKTQDSPKAVEILTKRLTLLVWRQNGATDHDACLRLHLRALAAVDGNDVWLSFPYYANSVTMYAPTAIPFGSILSEICDKWADASVFDRNSPNISSMVDFVRGLQPPKGARYRYLKIQSLTIVDALNVQTTGDIFEGIYAYGSPKKTGESTMAFKRFPVEPNQWLVSDARRR